MPLKNLFILAPLMFISEVLHAADVNYPAAMGETETLLIGGGTAPTAVVAGQVKVGNGRLWAKGSVESSQFYAYNSTATHFVRLFRNDTESGLYTSDNTPLRIQRYGGAMVVGEDPGGSEIMRVAGAGLFQGGVTQTDATTGQVKIGGGKLSTGGTVVAGGGLRVTGAYPVGAAGAPGVISYEYPFVRTYVGDGTGYSWALSRRSGGITSDMLVVNDTNQNVGVGTADPSQRLHVNGTSRLGSYIYAGTGPSSGGFIGSNVFYNGTNYTKFYAGASAGGWKIGNSNGGTGDIHFQTAAWGADASNLTDATFPTRMTIASGGEVIIYGTAPAPGGSIDGQVRIGAGRVMVGGTLSAKEVKVTTSGADYVFEEGYRLRPLGEVEVFIKENRHLPEIAPARDMQRDGMEVASQVTMQLAKIEELTLYAIQAKKERDEALSMARAAHEKADELGKRLAALEELVRGMRSLGAK